MEVQIEACKQCGHRPDTNLYCPCKCHDRFRTKKFKS
jgi:hypothetical protein